MTDRASRPEDRRQVPDRQHPIEALAGELGLGLLVLRDGQCVHANDAYAEILGFRAPHELLESLPHWEGHCAPHDREIFRKQLAYIENGQNRSLQYDVFDRETRLKTLSAVLRAARWEGAPAVLWIILGASAHARTGDAPMLAYERYRHPVEPGVAERHQ